MPCTPTEFRKTVNETYCTDHFVTYLVIRSHQPEREPSRAAEDAEEPFEGRISDGARPAEGQLATRGEGTEEEPGIYRGPEKRQFE